MKTRDPVHLTRRAPRAARGYRVNATLVGCTIRIRPAWPTNGSTVLRRAGPGSRGFGELRGRREQIWVRAILSLLALWRVRVHQASIAPAINRLRTAGYAVAALTCDKGQASAFGSATVGQGESALKRPFALCVMDAWVALLLQNKCLDSWLAAAQRDRQAED